jgi:hypothetical protein
MGICGILHVPYPKLVYPYITFQGRIPVEGIPMHLLLITKHDQLVEGILLAAGQGTIRVAARGSNDTLELRRVGDTRWMTNRGKTYEIAAVSASSQDDAVAVQAAIQPAKSLAAGSANTQFWQ